MPIKLALCCGLLALTGTVAFAQTHPRQKPTRRQPEVQRQVAKSAAEVEREPWPYLPEYYSSCVKQKAVVKPFNSNRIYTYVEQMPTLHGQPAFTASIAAIMHYLVLPPEAPAGRVFAQFTVDKDGRVRHPKILKGLRADLDSAVVAAMRQLPLFSPGKQNGQVVVAVSLALPVAILAKN